MAHMPDCKDKDCLGCGTTDARLLPILTKILALDCDAQITVTRIMVRHLCDIGVIGHITVDEFANPNS